MLRSLGALALGFLGIAVVWMTLIAILFVIGSRWAPDQFVLPQPGEEAKAPEGLGWLLATLAIDGIAAFAGGLIVVWLAPGGRWAHALIAAGMMCIGCVLQVIFDTGKLPAWVPLARVAVAPASLLLAARLVGDSGEPEDEPQEADISRPEQPA